MPGFVTRAKFEKEFLAFKPQLNSYLLRISGSRDDAEDISHDAYLKALQHLESFLGNSSIKTWVFTIATNLVRDHQRARKRWTTSCQDNARSDAFNHPERVETMQEISANSVAGAFDVREHIDFCFTCMAKTLTIEQQIAVILADVYDFTIAEIMEVAGLSEGKVKHALVDARQMLTRIFDVKCAFVSKKGACYQCTELNNIFNPLQQKQEEIQKIKMIRDFENSAGKEQLYQLRTELVKSIDPLDRVGSDLHAYFLSLMPQYCDWG